MATLRLIDDSAVAVVVVVTQVGPLQFFLRLSSSPLPLVSQPTDNSRTPSSLSVCVDDVRVVRFSLIDIGTKSF